MSEVCTNSQMIRYCGLVFSKYSRIFLRHSSGIKIRVFASSRFGLILAKGLTLQ